MQRTWKKCKQLQKNDSRAGKVAFLEFPGRPRFSGLSRPPISPQPRPTRFLSRPCTPNRERTPCPGRPKNEFPRASSPALSFFTAGWLSKSFCTCSLYLVLPRDNKRSVMVVIFWHVFFPPFSRSQNDNEMTITWQTNDKKWQRNGTEMTKNDKNDNTNPKWQTQTQKNATEMPKKWQNNYFGISNVCRPKIFLMLCEKHEASDEELWQQLYDARMMEVRGEEQLEAPALDFCFYMEQEGENERNEPHYWGCWKIQKLCKELTQSPWWRFTWNGRNRPYQRKVQAVW